MKLLLERVTHLLTHFGDTVRISDPHRLAEAFKLYDMLLTQQATLSAMICSAETIGTHGSALVDRRPAALESAPRTTRTLTRAGTSVIAPISAMPDPELWFETLLARKKKEMERKAGRV
jgi:hypothetical protein